MRRSSYYLKIPMLFLLVSLTLCGCAKEPPVADSSTSGTEPSQNASTQAEPVTLEQALLKERGKPYDQSDYKKFLGGDGIINEYAEFDCNLDHGYSKTVNDLVVADGKLYQANFNSVLAASPMDKAQHPLFRKVYRYAADGKTLEDHTAEYLNADKVYSGDPIITVVGGKVSLLFSGKYLDKGTTGWNWYRDMDRREYIAFDLDLTELVGETPIRLFNRNILMTNCAFYEIVYASEPLDDSDTKVQLAPDGSVSPYYPAAQHLNCDLKLRKIDLLTAFYGDVRNISTSHVITVDYTMLPIAEVLTDGYGAYQKYDPCRFYWDYNQK